MTAQATVQEHVPAALIWLDRSHALVARARDGGTFVTSVERELDDEHQFFLRVAHEADACDRLMVTGPDAARLGFEREYVALYRRPDRIIDGGLEMEPGGRDLADRLRFLRFLGTLPA